MKATVSTAAVGALLVGMLAGCGGSGATSSSGASNVLTVEANTVSSYQRNFNPMSTSANSGTLGPLYEPLLMITAVKPGLARPWLATKYAWADDGTKLTLQLRTGVQWSDGKPFSSKDVAYTFNTLTKYPALNTRGLTDSSVTAPDAHTVVLTFPHTAYAELPSVGLTAPVPQHIFAHQNPTTFANPNPVDTGPFVLKSFSTQVYTYAKNPHYWQAKPKVDELRYPTFSATTFDTALSQGKIDWAGGFVANLDNLFTNRDKAHNKHWFPADGLVSLFMNLSKAPFNDLVLRQAISMAIDRSDLSKLAEDGFEQPASPTGLVLPAFKSFLATQYAKSAFSLDVTKANTLLDNAGYKKGSNGIRSDKSGKPLSFSLIVPSGYVDWVTMSGLIKNQLQKIGITVKPQGQSVAAWLSALKDGNYQMAIEGSTSGSTPYYLYRNVLSSKLTAPTGKAAASNYSRWSDPQTDKLLSQFSATNNLTTQKQAIAGIEQIMVTKLPFIPLLGSSDWAEFRTTKFTGWPSSSDQYAMPAPFENPDNLLVLLHLQPA